MSAGISLPYGCANGSCGDCKARIVSGEIDRIRFHDFALTESEKLNGICLLCSYAAKSDLIVEVTEATSIEDMPFQQTRGKLCHLEQLSGIWITRFKLTRGKALRYLPGQYASVTLPNKQRLNLPIANCPCESSYLEFHIPVDSHLPIDKLRPLDRVAIDGPHGRFTLSDTEQSINATPVLFVAFDLGFSAIKPLIEHVLSLEEETPFALAWIATQPENHYKHNLCRSWSDAFDQFTYLQINSVDDLEHALTTSWPQHLTDAVTYISGDAQDNGDCIKAVKNAGVNADSISVNEATDHS